MEAEDSLMPNWGQCMELKSQELSASLSWRPRGNRRQLDTKLEPPHGAEAPRSWKPRRLKTMREAEDSVMPNWSDCVELKSQRAERLGELKTTRK